VTLYVVLLVVMYVFNNVTSACCSNVINSVDVVIAYRALKSREISRENTGIFAHMWHQRSLLGVNQSRRLTLNDHWRSKAI